MKSGDYVILDVGTTAMALASVILDRPELNNVTIFPSGIIIAFTLEASIGRLQIVVLGGTLRSQKHPLVKPMGTLI